MCGLSKEIILTILDAFSGQTAWRKALIAHDKNMRNKNT